MTTALASLYSGVPARSDTAMTGEVTLTGLVLPIGGLKEKVLAARRSGVREVIMPFENEVNVKEDLKSEQIADMKIDYVRTVDEVMALALQPRVDTPAEPLAHFGEPLG